ncbi:MAG: DNA-binding protein [Thermoleophilia bacterium]|nr:DNA-binding protein [Thermoleophilia bacterium]
MKEYEFTLRFSLPADQAHSDELLERLGDSGCDDALIGIGHAGRIALEFVREADSARGAIFSAITDVKRALPEAVLNEVSPDLVGITDIAEIVGRSRQNLRKLLVSCTSGGPAPIHEGKLTIWHLAPVLRWLVTAKGYSVNPDLLEVSEETMEVNAAISSARADGNTREELRELLV